MQKDIVAAEPLSTDTHQSARNTQSEERAKAAVTTLESVGCHWAGPGATQWVIPMGTFAGQLQCPKCNHILRASQPNELEELLRVTRVALLDCNELVIQRDEKIVWLTSAQRAIEQSAETPDFDTWFSEQGGWLSNERVCRRIWDAALAFKDAQWQEGWQVGYALAKKQSEREARTEQSGPK